MVRVRFHYAGLTNMQILQNRDKEKAIRKNKFQKFLVPFFKSKLFVKFGPKTREHQCFKLIGTKIVLGVRNYEKPIIFLCEIVHDFRKDMVYPLFSYQKTMEYLLELAKDSGTATDFILLNMEFFDFLCQDINPENIGLILP